jgi:hypothetical protein
MAAIIKLDDGRLFRGSNLGTGGMLYLISSEVSDSHSRLRQWLADVSNRCAPFMDFDTRGLPEADRAEFWRAAEAALATLASRQPLIQEQSHAAECLIRLIQMNRHRVFGDPLPPTCDSDDYDPRPFDGRMVDMDQIWNNDEGT